jgi:organic radical activating enzyme
MGQVMGSPYWLNIELTNRCNKSCSFCQFAEERAKNELGDMDLQTAEFILEQFEGQIIQFHRDGEPLLYKHLRKLGALTKDFTTNIVTNGLLLWERRNDIDKFDTFCVSVTEDDEKQFEVVKKFVDWLPLGQKRVLIKFLGDYYNDEYRKLKLRTTSRVIHGENYSNNASIIPELNVCLDFLMKPAIDWQGNLRICNRFDPQGLGIIDNVRYRSLFSMWNGAKRQRWLQDHLEGRRDRVPLCEDCDYWGIPAKW